MASTMEPKRSSLTKSEVDAAVQATSMAIREKLMYYYKTNIGENLTNSNVTIVPDAFGHDRSSRTRHYERRNYELKNPVTLYVGNSALFKLEKHPNILGFYTIPLKRSKVMRDIRSNIEDFVSKYLRSVEVKEMRGGTGNQPVGTDKKLIMGNTIREDTNPEDARSLADTFANIRIPGRSSDMSVTAAQLSEYQRIMSTPLNQRPMIDGFGINWE